MSGNNVTVSGLLGSPSAATVSAWVKLVIRDTEGAEVISLSDYIGVRADYSASGVRGFYHYASGWREIDTGIFIEGTGWHHLVFVTDPANSRQTLYIDGVQQASGTFSDAIHYSGLGSNTIIGEGANGSSDFSFNGTIDDVRIYNRALTAAEVKQLHNLGTVIIRE